MTAKERTLWEQAVRVLRQNSVSTIVGVPRPERVTAKAAKRGTASSRHQKPRHLLAGDSRSGQRATCFKVNEVDVVFDEYMCKLGFV